MWYMMCVSICVYMHIDKHNYFTGGVFSNSLLSGSLELFD